MKTVEKGDPISNRRQKGVKRMQNGGMLLMLLLLLIYTFGGDGTLSSENLTLIVLALAFLVSDNYNAANGCGCSAAN